MVTIRNELREGDEGEPEIWTNLGDILTWLDSLPAQTNNRIAAAVAQEIREMLFDQVQSAELRPRGES
jgi:hypothetical protein